MLGPRERASFASGSRSAPVYLNGTRHVPGQGNNIFIPSEVGLGALERESREVTEGMFLAAAQTLAQLVQPEDRAMGRVYSALTKMREVSLGIATAVAEAAYALGLPSRSRPAEVTGDIRSRMFDPKDASQL
jgi:malate dehydrogenase (oxaloacetate-decarboxylating)(NADP+)